MVPPRKGRVDLNMPITTTICWCIVPPRKGRVDLNMLSVPYLVEKIGPAPQGAGGFKCSTDVFCGGRGGSRPARGGWI